MRLISFVLILFLLATDAAKAKTKKNDDYHWTNVDRVVAIGDFHGDYEQYLTVMQSAGLINKSGKWIGGETHFVQTGDVTDRGDHSRKIVDHLVKLAKQAKKKGGYVHLLIGNHEAMNVIGDLRYVTAGEFKAFESRNAVRLQEMQWNNQIDWMRVNVVTFEEMDLEAYRKEWEQRVPLGWVEHRQAWSLSGDYGKWVAGNQVAVQVNDTIFLHGGISEKYCQYSLQSLTEQSIAAMESYDPRVESIIDDPWGPLWYRGLANEDESDVFSQTLDNILNRYGAKRIVVGHSPTGGAVWPRFDQRVVVNDTGIASYYGSHKGVLELTAEGATTIYGDIRIPLPVNNEGRIDYLRSVIEADSNNGQLKARLARMLAPPVERPNPTEASPEASDSTETPEVISVPGTCQ